MNEEFDDLITAYFAGKLSEEEFDAMEKRLAENPETQTEFVKRAKLESALRDRCTGAEQAAAHQKPAIARQPLLLWAGLAAAIALVVGFAIRGMIPQENSKEIAQVEQTIGVAVISAEANANWDQLVARGSSLKPGTYELKSGLAQIDFFGGATVSLAGPAKIELISGEEAVLHSGKLRASVPPAARGFEIRAAEVLVEDLGTSFGLEVDPQGASSLVVFDGEVRTHDSDRETQLLKSGDAVNLRQGKTEAANGALLGNFPALSDILAESGADVDGRYAIWKASSEKRKRDPRLVAYYDFESLKPATKRLANRAPIKHPSELDGGIVGARVAEGRWPGKTALDFRREGDRVRFAIPGEFAELTIFAWVRIDALDRNLNSLFLTDYFDPNEFHWQLSRKGALHFATSPKGVDDIPRYNRRFYSELFWSPEQSGRWFFFATTVDTVESRVTHYINGQPVGFSGGTNMEKPLNKLRIGKADLGNWTDPIWTTAIRTLNGRIDEFAIYRAELAADEIAEIFAHGNP